jgi:isopentenyl-diphosphate Delta-isomerase
MGRIAVVDMQNRFVRWEERKTIHEQRLIHRSIHVIGFDEENRMVIQKRHRNKQTYASYWDFTASGHVEEEDYSGGPDENLDAAYELTARRETQEEIGVEPLSLSLLRRVAPQAGLHYEQTYIYIAKVKGPFAFQESELEEIRTVSLEALQALFQSGEKVTPLFQLYAEELIQAGRWPT